MDILDFVPVDGIIEQIGTGQVCDTLMISNRRKNLWLLNLFNGYKQLGTYDIAKDHNFQEGDLVIVEFLNDKIAKVTKDIVKISNVNEIYQRL